MQVGQLYMHLKYCNTAALTNVPTSSCVPPQQQLNPAVSDRFAAAESQTGHYAVFEGKAAVAAAAAPAPAATKTTAATAATKSAAAAEAADYAVF